MTIAETLISKAPPLRIDEQGAVRIGNSRVTLELVLGEYLRGSSAEQISKAFETVGLANVHAVISYYLLNKEVVDDYLAMRAREAEQLIAQARSRPNQGPSSDELNRRLAATKAVRG